MLRVGSLLDGKYKILNEIGHGGMSVVYLALNERANKTWAVKEVRKDGKNDNEVVTQGLVAEVEMLKRLNHPNLPNIIDVIDKDDSFIIVMDYIEGKSLQSVLNHDGAQSPDLVIDWAKQLCDVLGYLHSRKPAIIYRDMKPANVMLKPTGEAMLIDFGTAREYKERKATGDTTWLGTRGYAAPEQFGGQGETDARTDIYNLGATMYHLLTGYSPADTNFVIYPLGKLKPELSGTGIEKVVAKCCEPRREDRYQNCAELMYALEHVHDEDDQVRKERNKKWFGFMAAVLVALLGVAGMIAFTIVKNRAISNSYDQTLKTANNEESIVDAKDEYQWAMCLRPSDETAYDQMLEHIDRDGGIDQNEKAALNSCLQALPYNGGSLKNIDVLKKRNGEAYANFYYNLGKEYFFSSTDASYIDAVVVLGDIYESEFLDEHDRNIAKSLYIISSEVNKTANNSSDDDFLDSGDEITEVWDQFEDLVGDADTATEKCGDVTVAMAIYKQLCVNISNKGNEFKQAGITKEQMTDILEQADYFLENNNYANSDNQAIKNLYLQTNTALDAAKEAAEHSIYKVAGTSDER